MKKRKNRKVKITKNSTYYRWLEDAGANVKIYPCEHEKVDYKALQKLQDKTMEELKKRDKDVEDLQVKLGESVEQLVLNNHYHEKRLERYAKLYVGYKRKYQGLFTLREAAIKMGITQEQVEEEEVGKEFEFKDEVVTLESGKSVYKVLLKKKHTKH